MSDAFRRAVEHIIKLHEAKAADYTSGRGEFHNYEAAAREANITPEQFIEAQIANKNERRKSLEYRSTDINYESFEDTLLDRAVFAIIRYAMYLDRVSPGQASLHNRKSEGRMSDMEEKKEPAYRDRPSTY